MSLCCGTNRAYVEHPLLFAVSKLVYWEHHGYGTKFQSPFPAQNRNKKIKKEVGRKEESKRFPLYLLDLCETDIHWHVYCYRWNNSILLCIQPTEFDLYLRLLGSVGFAKVGGEEPVL